MKTADRSKRVTLRLPAAVLENLHVNEPARELFARLRNMSEGTLCDALEVGSVPLVTLTNSLASVSICCRAVYTLIAGTSGCTTAQKVQFCFYAQWPTMAG